MSRIHEALQRAERAGHSGDGPMLDVLSDALPSTQAPQQPSGEFAGMDLEAVPADASPGNMAPLSPDSWMADLPQQKWAPKGDYVLFAEAESGHSAAHEQFRTLRSRLYQIRANQTMKTVLVASALPGEGKTFVSVNLALVLARQHGRRVLLVDSDLRKPRLHEVLGTPATPGLSDYLSATADERSAIQKTPLQNLYFMPAGTLAPNPSELIGTGGMAKLIRALTPFFDWIIVDTPPVIPVSDATLMAEACDGVILVLKAGSTPYDIAQRARDEFRSAPVVGVVLNRTGKGHSYGVYYYELYGNEPVAGGSKG